MAVMTGGYKNFRLLFRRFQKLFRLYPAAFQSVHFKSGTAIYNAPAGAAAVIMFAVRMHLDKIFAKFIYHKPGLFVKSPPP